MTADEVAAAVAQRGAAARTDGSECPVGHEKASGEEIAALMAQHRADAAADGRAAAPAEESKCPVDHRSMSKEEVASYMARAGKLGMAAEAPVGPEVGTAADAGAKGRPTTVYDVYGQEMDPSNMMPATPNQLPSPGQETRLSTERVSSSIPKSEADGTWTYPSPQMFYNALKRKDKADDVLESDMDSVVAIHNSMNEGTWEEVLAWERRFHCGECPNPKLRRFRGRPHDLSPAARFRSTFRGYPAPFDRHDWVVDRCGKRDVRYIIDYYYRERTEGGAGPIELHVRPALDSPGAAWDRLRHGVSAFQGALLRSGDRDQPPPAPASAPSAPKPAAAPPTSDAPVRDDEFAFLRTLTPEKIDAISEGVKRDCGSIGLAMAKDRSDAAAYEQANVALNYCMATKVCQPQAKLFMSAMERSPGSESAAYADMTACLDRFHIMARRVMAQSSGVAQTGPEQI
jgi:cytochrome c heme-lyase